MTFVGIHPEEPAMRPGVRRPRILLLAADERACDSIAAVLDQAGDMPSTVLADSNELADHEIDAGTVIVVSCDIDRPRQMTALRRLSQAAGAAAIVVVSPPSTATAVRRTLDAGAAGLVFESALAEALIPTLRAVENGQAVVPRSTRAGVERPHLSNRERQVLGLICEGFTNGEIAASLFLAESTVKSHVASIFTKFGVHSRKELAVAFSDLSLTVHPEETAETGV
jgi:DNA-binding NarL/FixJ family response regulator